VSADLCLLLSVSYIVIQEYTIPILHIYKTKIIQMIINTQYFIYI